MEPELIVYLESLQRQDGALCDPDSKEPIKNSYANAFFALLCSLQGKYSKALKAVEYELSIAKQYYQTSGIYRWEFKNYAILSSFLTLQKQLSPEQRALFMQYLKHAKNLNSFQTNYSMMRALNSLMRYQILKQKKDLLLSKLELKMVLSRQDSAGFFYDTPEHKSFQYHAYTLALLFQYYTLEPSAHLERAFLKGVNFLLPFVDPQGDCNYVGRGQKQIFGYISYIYALIAAASLAKNRFYLDVADRIMGFCTPTLRSKSIVINDFADQKIGWYAYNNRSDYLCFAACYLRMAKDLRASIHIERNEPLFDYASAYNKFYPTLGIFLLREKEFLICLGTTYNCARPILYHIYPAIFPTSGGPPYALSSKQPDYQEAFFAARYRTKARFSMNADTHMLTIQEQHRDADIVYTFAFDERVKLQVKADAARKVIPLHFCAKDAVAVSIPVVKKNKILTLDGIYSIYEVPAADKTEFTLRFASLREKHVLTPFSFSQKASAAGFKAQKALFFAGIMGAKLLFDFKDFKKILQYAKVKKGYYQR